MVLSAERQKSAKLLVAFPTLRLVLSWFLPTQDTSILRSCVDCGLVNLQPTQTHQTGSSLHRPAAARSATVQARDTWHMKF